VQIMSPNYEADPADKKFVPKEQWFPAPAQPTAEQPATGQPGESRATPGS
jgi:hypothetical protein